MRHRRHHSFHREFILYIDHDSFRHLHQQDKVSPRHARWVSYLEQFTFVVKHKAGFANRVADALSRRSSLLVIMRVEVPDFDYFHGLLAVDPYFSVILQNVQVGEKTDFLLHGGNLFKGDLLCILDCSLHLQIIKELYGEGHVGRYRTLQLVQASDFWPTIHREWSRSMCSGAKFVKSLRGQPLGLFRNLV